MVRRAAGDDHDLVDLAELGIGEAHLVEVEQPLPVHAAAQRIGHGLGLLRDLLEHEEVVAALFGGRGIPGDREGLRLAHLAVKVGDDHVIARDLHDLVLTEFQRLARVGDEGGDVGGEEVLALA